jgi:hypothetical protein
MSEVKVNYNELFASLKTEESYREYCLEKFPKYKFQIEKMNQNELKRMIFSEEHPVNDFEGIATIITCCNKKDINKLITYIFSISLEPPNILRVLFTTLDNVSYYEGVFCHELLKFKANYEKKLREKLFELGMKSYIDKLDLIRMFVGLINGR